MEPLREKFFCYKYNNKKNGFGSFQEFFKRVILENDSKFKELNLLVVSTIPEESVLNPEESVQSLEESVFYFILYLKIHGKHRVY